MDELGVNSGNTLKFSPGGQGITSAADYNKWQEGVYSPGIVDSELGDDGYPVLSAKTAGADSEESLAYLFDDTNDASGYQILAYDQVLDMFVSDGYGGYSFDSLANYIYYDAASGNCVVYNMPNDSDKTNGQLFPFNTVSDFFDANGNPIVYSSKVDATNESGAQINHYFGLSMSTEYVQPADGQVTDENGDLTDMILTFTGDADFWLYIDGQLALDLSGIHDKMTGTINFATGEIVATIGSTVARTNLATVLGDDWDAENVTHSLKLFYMERGNDLSNLKVTFNLQIPKYYYATSTTVAEKTTVGEEKYAYAADQLTYSSSDTTTYSYATRSDYGVRENTVAVLYVHHLTPDGNKEKWWKRFGSMA